MKKIYETPALELLVLKSADFLSTSGDAVGADGYNTENYPYGETLS